MTSSRRYGLFMAFAAYGAWGALPLYWKLLSHVPAIEVFAHRVVWSVIFLSFTLSLRGDWRAFRALLFERKLAPLTLSAVLIAANWLVYIWAVQEGRVVECSLGYFILPLVNVAFGVFALGEKLRPLQIISMCIAAAGVFLRAWDVGGVPILSLVLAMTFALYGVVRKKLKVESVVGLTFETALMLLPALLFLGYRELEVTSTLAESSMTTWLLLVGAGAVTSLPLLAFNEAAKKLPLSVLGVIQYVSPTLQFLSGVFLFNESIGNRQWTAFTLIWFAVALFTLDGVRGSQTRPTKGKVGVAAS